MRQAIKVVLPWAAPEFGSRHALLDVGQSSGGVISRPWRFESQALRRTPSPNGNLRLASAFFTQEAAPTPAQVATFAETHRHTFGVAPLLAAIGEPVSTFYDRSRPTAVGRGGG
jgi:hypothetical protein